MRYRELEKESGLPASNSQTSRMKVETGAKIKVDICGVAIRSSFKVSFLTYRAPPGPWLTVKTWWDMRTLSKIT